MSPKISFSFRKRAKLTKLFYKNPSDSFEKLLMSNSIEFSNLIITGKEHYEKKMAEKLDNPFTAPKACRYQILAHYLFFSYKTQKRISDFEIKEDDILLIITIVNPNKAHGWDNVSIRLNQRCGKSVVKFLKYLFVSSLTAGIVPED